MDERAARVLEAAAAAGAECAVLTSPAAVAYATGFAPFGGAGPSPFDAAPPLAVVSPEEIVLVVADADADAPVRDEVTVRDYHVFAPSRRRRDPLDAYLAVVRDCVGRRCAVERTLPSIVAGVIGRRVSFDAELRRARLTKTAEEVEALRAAAELASTGQRAALAALAPGRTELELFAEVRAAMEAAAGEPLALGADLLSGERTLKIMGPPTQREIRPGDPVLCDLVPRLGAYWGDSSTTPVAGEPAERFERLHRTARDALEHGVETARPGITAGELDAAVRGVIEQAGYTDPIHVGHGIGVTNFEAPRIVPGESTRIQAGMVLMLEPTAVDPGVAAVRLEWMIHVGDGGAQVLSSHELLTA
jgi:Xaa-Pro aminopeptidase